MPKIIATLKQHTPIMHFQYDENGATLRGTEMKSGLDTFLNAYAGTGNTVKNEKNEEKPERPEWHMGTKKALNYRVMVQTEGRHVHRLIFNPRSNNKPGKNPAEQAMIDRDQEKLRRGYLDITNTPFFALMGKEHDRDSRQEAEKYAACIADKVTVTLMVPDPDLAKIIVQWLPIYFLVNNFGARKSKGFGSFTVTGLTLNGESQPLQQNRVLLEKFLLTKQPDQDGFESALYAMKDAGPTRQNGFRRNMTQIDDKHPLPSWLTVTENINWLYKLMKSGYNFPSMDPRRKIYHRSYLMKGYAYHKEGITYSNDKRAIKQCIMHIGNPYFKGYLAYDDENGVKQDNYDERGNIIPGNTGILKRYYPRDAQVSDLQKFRPDFEEKYRFVRAMLGLTDNMQYRTPKDSPSADRRINTVTGKTVLGTTINIVDCKRMYQEGPAYYVKKNTDGTIRRFESPLLFKPVEINGKWQCFILLKKIPEEMFGKEFFFYRSRDDKRESPDKNKNGDDKVTSPQDCFCIKTPSKNEFNLVEFMEFCSDPPKILNRNGSPIGFEPLNLERLMKKEVGR